MRRRTSQEVTISFFCLFLLSPNDCGHHLIFWFFFSQLQNSSDFVTYRFTVNLPKKTLFKTDVWILKLTPLAWPPSFWQQGFQFLHGVTAPTYMCAFSLSQAHFPILFVLPAQEHIPRITFHFFSYSSFFLESESEKV